MKTNLDRVAETIEFFGRIGASEGGGLNRPSFSRMEEEAQIALKDLLTTEGAECRVDALGSLFGRLPGTERGLPAILVGSHLDTVPNGGRFDGALGVIGAIEVLRVLREQRLFLRHPLEIVAFAAEEASRFALSTIGSRAFVGQLTVSDLQNARDAEGYTAYQALRDLGRNPDDLYSARCQPQDYACFLELHIEQGLILLGTQTAVGLVTHIANSTRLEFSFTGRADHSGSTPMDQRKDALRAAAQVVVDLPELVKKNGGAETVGTVSTITIEPNSLTVVPGKAVIGLDIRDIAGERKQKVAAAVEEAAIRSAELNNVRLDCKVLKDEAPTKLNLKIVAALEEAAKDQGISAGRMFSGAGHDAMVLAPQIPTAMIFVPSQGGLSHCPEEYTSTADAANGIEVLLHGILKLDRSLS